MTTSNTKSNHRKYQKFSSYNQEREKNPTRGKMINMVIIEIKYEKKN